MAVAYRKHFDMATRIVSSSNCFPVIHWKAEIQKGEIIRRGALEIGLLYLNASSPITIFFKRFSR